MVVGGVGTIARSTNAGSSTFGISNIYERKQVGFIPTYTPRNIPQSLNATAVGSYLFPNALTGISTDVAYERVVVVGVLELFFIQNQLYGTYNIICHIK